ncbi:MAG TPA: bifunctional hydroxymethylpyrimidine kinase/phosphomethylpyrimidine kinase [Casimicrobiaceae bacterium]|nr:bifunctional hydroxymethylpyrimidine kinase/phosphomethylpyrimidine kinase [Casimicrobiaceae bacterium]
MTASTLHNIVSIAGVDPSGGAGILADVKAISANNAYACAVVAALTAQNTLGVTSISPVPHEFVREQIDTLFADVRIDAAKIGMLGRAQVINVVADRLTLWRPAHLVLDPVMIAKSGHALLESAAVGALTEALLPLATIITPNLPEAAVLLDVTAPENVRGMRRCAERLRNKMTHQGERWVYLKGGHLPGSEAVDILHDGDRMIELVARRIDTSNTHGTGCTLSAALAALVPQAPDVPTAARKAKDYLTRAIEQSGRLDVGKGNGPVHHFHVLDRATRSRPE